MKEFTIIRMDRWEDGTLHLPLISPRRCRYYVHAVDETSALAEAAKRWPKEKDFRILESNPARLAVV